MILRDMMMLENQIPLFVLKKMWQLQHSSLILADVSLRSMLVGLCKDLSPFKMRETIPVLDCAHLLDLLYHMIVSEMGEPSDHEVVVKVDDQKEVVQGKKVSFPNISDVNQLLSNSKISLLKKLSKLVQIILQFPWRIIGDSKDKDGKKTENDINKPPLAEEITIPSVTQLSKSGVSFSPADGGISTKSFDATTVTLKLPTMCLDINTEVVLRNLVAYEASNALGPLFFTRFTKLITGIIDTEEDARLLSEKRIIFNHLKSDKEVANMCNGMSKSIRLTEVPELDKVIEDVNKYYNGRLKVKAKAYVCLSWQCLAFVATVLLLIFTALDTICSVFTCNRIFDA